MSQAGGTLITKAERALAKEAMLVLHFQGKSPKEIADELNCSQSYVRRSLPDMLDLEAERLAEITKREITSQIGTLHFLRSEVLREWRRSCEDRTETAERTEGEFGSPEDMVSGKPGKIKSSSSTTKTAGLGDPRYIEQLRAIQADIRRILRLDKDDALRDALANIHITQVNVSANPFIPINLPPISEVAALMAEFGMSPDGMPLPDALPAPQSDEDGDSDAAPEEIVISSGLRAFGSGDA